MLLKKFEVNLQTIQINLINENEEAIVTIISSNNEIIEDISLCNYSITNCINDLTSKIGIEFTEFEKFLKKLNHPVANIICDTMKNINSSIKYIYNLNQTLIILLSNHEESILKNINEINKIIELQTQLAY
jgi:UDP-N-acetylglucosamine 2-epimerase